MHEGYTLVVDNDPKVRDMIVKSFQSFGYTCREAADGLEALDFIQRDKFDIVVCDIRMQGLDGIELIAKARQMMRGRLFDRGQE